MVLKKILAFVLLLVVVLLSVAIYRAYVIFKPCQHKIPKVEAKIQLTDEQVERLRSSLQIPTVSVSRDDEDLEAKAKHLQFIRKGSISMSLLFFFDE